MVLKPVLTNDMAFLGDPISDNQIESHSGYLICRNVPFLRTGSLTYLGSEIGLTGADANAPIIVDRDESAILDPATMASFEAMTLTDLHPEGGEVTLQNRSVVDRGHIQNIRPGAKTLLCDVVVKDSNLMEKVRKFGFRQVSPGYRASYEKTGDRRYQQVSIIGNHLAVVPVGRQGPRCAVQDHATVPTTARMITMKDPNAIALFALAQSGNQEAFEALYSKPAAPVLMNDAAAGTAHAGDDKNVIAKLVDALLGKTTTDAAAGAAAPAAKPAAATATTLDAATEARFQKIENAVLKIAKHVTKDEGEGEENKDAMDIVEDLVDQAVDVVENVMGEPVAAALELMLEDTPAADEGTTTEDTAEAVLARLKGDPAAMAMVNAMKPAIAKMNKADRKIAVDSMAGLLGRGGNSGYTTVQKNVAAHQKTTTDAAAAKSAGEQKELGKNWAKQYNPHFAEAK